MQLEGTIKTVTFHNPQNGFTVLRVILEGSKDKKPTVVTGTFPDLQTGERLRMEGEWTRHPKFGDQFSCVNFQMIQGNDGSMVEFIANGNFPGVGPKTAERIVEIFGDETADVLDNHPERFRGVKIKGLTAAKVEQFLARWQEVRRSRETMLFLYAHEITGSIAKKLWQRFGEATIGRIKEDPYMLCDEIWGVGFLKADEIARKVGIPEDSPQRLAAALLYSLQESSFSEGHVYLPSNVLIEKTIRYLRLNMNDDDLIQILLDKFEDLCHSERIVRQGDDCYYPPMYRAERLVAEEVLSRLNQNELPTFNIDQDLVDWEREHKFAFDPVQKKAINMALSYKISIITGGPGTGKTTILRGILHMAQKFGEVVHLAAPTGRAADRMGQLTGLPARTIHRLLEVDPVTRKFKKGLDSKLECHLLIVDEFSMMDINLCAALFEALSSKTRLVIVGDKDQLPSVGPGNVLNDLLRCPKIPSVRLEHIFRQSGDNDIADKAAKINQGITPSPLDGPNFHFVPFETVDEAKDHIRQLIEKGVTSKISIDPKSDLQILSPMRKGPLGIFELNEFLQGLLNPGLPRHKMMGVSWSDGDKVMQLKNDYEKNVFNGDIGYIHRVMKDAGKIRVFFNDKTVEYETDELDQLSLAYATTIHKSQGSEYPAVIIILDSSHYMMLQRNLIYTAITRAKGHVWILSAPGAFHQAVRNIRSTRRYTRLTERLF